MSDRKRQQRNIMMPSSGIIAFRTRKPESALKRAREMHGVTPMRTGYTGPGTDKENEDTLPFGHYSCRTSAVPPGYCTDVPAFRPPGIREYPD